MKKKYIFWGNVLLSVYSSLALIFYIMKLFSNEKSVNYFISYNFKSLFLILLLHFTYWLGAILYFFQKKRFNNLLISFGAIGFIVTGVADCIFVKSYYPTFYLFYFVINSIILISIGSSINKNFKISLLYFLLWIIIAALAYHFFNSILII